LSIYLLIKKIEPAPFGPTIPTRDDNEIPTETLDIDGLALPGYVKVPLDIFKIALVPLLIPNKILGGGNENLTEVAAKV
jgi:hypothetical protein